MGLEERLGKENVETRIIFRFLDSVFARDSPRERKEMDLEADLVRLNSPNHQDPELAGITQWVMERLHNSLPPGSEHASCKLIWAALDKVNWNFIKEELLDGGA